MKRNNVKITKNLFETYLLEEELNGEIFRKIQISDTLA